LIIVQVVNTDQQAAHPAFRVKPCDLQTFVAFPQHMWDMLAGDCNIATLPELYSGKHSDRSGQP
jgi:hypothetical protein